jgi:hypothetical protein
VAVLAVGVAALLPAGSALAGATRRGGTSTCGTAAVSASFSATFPDAVEQGAQVVAAQPTVTLVVPADAVSALRANGGTTVDASAAVDLTVAQASGMQTLTVAGLSTSDTALPESGDLEIALTGQAPGFTAETGQASVALAGLTPKLLVHNGTTTTDLGCAADPAANGPLAAVAVAQPATPASPAPQVTAAAADAPLLTAKFLVDGTSRIAKLGSDLRLNQGTFDAGLFTGDNGAIRIEGDLTLPPASGYFIAFRFLPVTSDVQLPQTEQATGTADISGGLYTPKIDVTAKVNLVLGNVKEDGVPVDVGTTCHTSSSLVIRMQGQTSLVAGSQSTIVSTFDIPPFTGCGVTENLNPLLTGLISGPGNTMTTTLTAQGVG